MKKARIILVVCFSITILCTCSSSINDRIFISSNAISNDMKFLTNNTCDGRAPGTSGNEKAANYIVDRMQNMGLLPLADDWMHSYETTVRHLNPKKMSLSVSSNNSTPYDLIYGNDYWETIIGPEIGRAHV